jgi:hypothetical protein
MKSIFFTALTLLTLVSLSVSAQWSGSGNNIFNNNSGFVGIGNSTPTTLLDVGKNMVEPTITVRNLGGTGGATFRMADQSSGADWKFKATNNGGFKIRDNAAAMDVITVEPSSDPNMIYITAAGNMGIGTSAPGVKLAVNGNIKCKLVEVSQQGWSDFVFEEDYELMPIEEVETFIQVNGHLPSVPSADEVMSKGNNLAEMDAILLQKIEELTLYVIELKKENEELRKLIEE